MELKILHTVVFDRNYKQYKAGKRFIINQGGSRSSKTYSIIQLLVFLCLVEKVDVSVVRKSFPSLRGSVLRDFIEIMMGLNLYTEDNHNKSEQRYTFNNGSTMEFFSIDDPQKVRGRKRDICYCNEANELDFEDFQQLSLRTNKCIFFDFNPSDNEHWIYDLCNDDRAVLIKSNYKDNNFLSDTIKEEIENLIRIDENYYKIYALGERPIPTTRIYNHFKQYDEDIEFDDWCYGCDFGYNHPSVIVKVGFKDDVVYVEELIYQSNLTSQDLIRLMKEINIDKKKYIYADYARPEMIEEMRRAGFNVKEAVKDVKEGIMSIKMKQVFIHKNSLNTWKEYKSYSWKTNKEQILDEPIKLYDDAMDALRYAVYTTDKKGKFDKKYVGFF